MSLTTLGLTAASITTFIVMTTMFRTQLFNSKQNGYLNRTNVTIDPLGPEVQFVLFTRDHSVFNLKLGDTEGFKISGFNASNPTKFIIHGFLSSIKEDVVFLNKEAYLKSGDFNVFGVDWSALCEKEYFTAFRGVQITGSYLGRFINWLIELGVSEDSIHLIGHSLGAHVAAIAGNRIERKIGRITGLDPAGPGFNDIRPDLKLDPNDAKLVDVVHTYMRVLSLAQPLGHVDFYPNGGRFQPGCPDIYDILRIPESLTCNHARAYEFFAESILNKKAFKSYKCSSVEDALNNRCFEQTTVYMGQEDTYMYGLYYFQTKAESPYSLSY